MRIPTIRNVPTPSALFSNAHTLYDDLSASITRMAASFNREDELWPQFEVSVQAVTNIFKMLEENVITPTTKFVEIAFRRSPIISTFVSVFLILVSLPLLSFLGFVVFVVASAVFTSLCAALFASAILIGLYGTLLSMLIVLLTALSAWISTSIVLGYLVWRLFVLVRASGRAGVSQWSAETTERFRRQKKDVEERRGRSPGAAALAREEETKPPPDPANQTTGQ